MNRSMAPTRDSFRYLRDSPSTGHHKFRASGHPHLPQGPPPPVYGRQRGPIPEPLLRKILVAVGVLAQVLGIPAQEASAASGAQVAAAARREAGEGRSVRGMKDPTKALTRIHDNIDSKVSGPIYKWTSAGNCPCTTTQSFFCTRSPRYLVAADGGIWVLTPDRSSNAGLSHLRPELDRMSSLRRDLLQEIIGDHLGTHDGLTSTELVEVPAHLPGS